jgi:hypothetical protein
MFFSLLTDWRPVCLNCILVPTHWKIILARKTKLLYKRIHICGALQLLIAMMTYGTGECTPAGSHFEDRKVSLVSAH